jgi:hypothetical protein
MRKKTLEEKRATNAARQRRWRKNNAWLAEQRRLAVYGKSKAQKAMAAAITNNAVEDGLIRGEAFPDEGRETIRPPRKGPGVTNNAIVSWDRPGTRTEEERRVVEETERFIAKKAGKSRLGTLERPGVPEPELVL